MKNIIKKFWGVGLVVILLSTLFVGTVPQASANPYAFSGDLTQPTAVNGVLAPAVGFGIVAVAQSGSTIVATGKVATAANYLYRSLDAGATWLPIIPAVGPGGSYWGYVALAPDDPNIIAVVDTAPTADVVT